MKKNKELEEKVTALSLEVASLKEMEPFINGKETTLPQLRDLVAKIKTQDQHLSQRPNLPIYYQLRSPRALLFVISFESARYPLPPILNYWNSIQKISLLDRST